MTTEATMPSTRPKKKADAITLGASGLAWLFNLAGLVLIDFGALAECRCNKGNRFCHCDAVMFKKWDNLKKEI